MLIRHCHSGVRGQKRAITSCDLSPHDLCCSFFIVLALLDNKGTYSGFSRDVVYGELKGFLVWDGFVYVIVKGR